MAISRTAGLALAAALVTSASPVIGAPSAHSPAENRFADLGNCAAYTPQQPHHGGYESDIVSTTRGIVSRVYTKNYDLCNNPVGGDSASTAYLMLTREFDQGTFGRWYQVGNVKLPGKSCPVYYMQYNPGTGAPPTTNYSTACTASITWYRFVLKKFDATPDDYWAAYVLLDSTGIAQWNAPNDPISLAWFPDDAEVSSEVFNDARDQSGGGNSSRLTFDAGYWWRVDFTAVPLNMQGAERACHLCGTSGPYNTQWYDGNTFEVWTDGF